MNAPIDVNGDLMKPGDFVVYSPGDRNVSLQFGVIDKIDEEFSTNYQGDVRVSYYLVINKTDSRRNPEYKRVWRDSGYVTLDKQCKSGKLNYRQSRFMIMP